MGLNIKNSVVEHLATEIARLTGETKTEAIRKALEDRKRRLMQEVSERKQDDITAFLRREIWPYIPPQQRGRRLTREEEDDILGFGPDGV